MLFALRCDKNTKDDCFEKENKMKKILCFVLSLVFVAVLLCGCGFNYDKEDLSEYVKLPDLHNFTYAQMEAGYLEYRKLLVSDYKTAEFTVEEGFTVSFKVTSEIVSESKSEDGGTTTYSYTRYEPWCLETDENQVKNYDFGKETSNLNFDYALRYAVADASSSSDTDRKVKLGTAFSFTMTLPHAYDNADVAGKKIRFTITLTDVLPGLKDDSIYSQLTAFFDKCGYYKDIIEDGDWIVMDFIGQIDGKTFDGGSATDQSIQIGGGYVFDEFENALLGHKTGEKFMINVTFPDNYEDTSLAGKNADFYITVDEIYNTNYTVRENTEFDSIWELKNAMRVISYAKGSMMAIVLDGSEIINYPSSLVTQYEKYYKDEVSANVSQVKSQYGYSESEAINMIYGSAEKKDQYITDSAKSDVLEALVTYAVKKELNVTFTNTEYKEDLNSLVAYMKYYYGTDITESSIEAAYTKDVLKVQFIYQRCNEAIYSEAKIDGVPDIPQAD